MDLKKPLPFDELADKMEEHHLVVNDRSEAIRVLQHISYYRLSGYLLPYRLSQNDSDLKDVAFEDLMAIYNFDSDLRNFLRKYIEIAEVYYRTQISHWFSLSRCSAPPHDQHYDEHNFYRKQSYHDVMRKYESDKAEYYGDSLVMQRDKADEEEEREVIVFLWFVHDIKSLCWEVSGVRKDKLNPKAANLIAEALDADERTERFLRQMIPSIGLQEKVADEDYEAPQEP